MASSFLSKCLPLYTNKHVGRHDASPREPGSLKSIAYILYRLHTAKPLGVEHELPQTLLEDLTARLKFALHVSQRTARILGTLLLRACVKHPLGETAARSCACLCCLPAYQPALHKDQLQPRRLVSLFPCSLAAPVLQCPCQAGRYHRCAHEVCGGAQQVGHVLL
jgi:hypothetical protein